MNIIKGEKGIVKSCESVSLSPYNFTNVIYITQCNDEDR